VANSTWLTSEKVAAVLGSDLSESIDDEAMQQFCNGAASYVEGRRGDLFVGDPAAFAPTPSVQLGAALLAYRFYSRRTSPLGVIGFTEDGAAGILKDDPDIARLLGIGRHGAFVFGGVRPVPVVDEVP
jgi:hypothetical protein